MNHIDSAVSEKLPSACFQTEKAPRAKSKLVWIIGTWNLEFACYLELGIFFIQRINFGIQIEFLIYLWDKKSVTALWKLGKNQVSCQMKCDTVTLVAVAHFRITNGGRSIRVKPGIGPVYRIKGL